MDAKRCDKCGKYFLFGELGTCSMSGGGLFGHLFRDVSHVPVRMDFCSVCAFTLRESISNWWDFTLSEENVK